MPLQYNAQIPVNLGKPPTAEQGPRVVPILLAFPASANSIIADDLALESMEGAENNVQSIWIDNGPNSGIFAITFPQTAQTIRVPANTQGFYPVLCLDQVNYSATHATASAKVQVAFYNAPLSYFSWKTV